MQLGAVPALCCGVPPTILAAAANFNSVLMEIRTGPTDFCVVTAISVGSFDCQGNTGSYAVLAIGKSAAAGVGRSSPAFVAVNGEDTSTLPGVQVFVDWSAPPQLPTTFFRRRTINIRGNSWQQVGVIFRIPQGLKLTPSYSLSVWCLNSSSLIVNDVSIDVES